MYDFNDCMNTATLVARRNDKSVLEDMNNIILTLNSHLHCLLPASPVEYSPDSSSLSRILTKSKHDTLTT